MKRVFLIVLDSVGIGEMPDAAEYHDEGSNTLLAASRSPYFSMPNMRSLGYFNIDGVHIGGKEANPKGAFARLTDQIHIKRSQHMNRYCRYKNCTGIARLQEIC